MGLFVMGWYFIGNKLFNYYSINVISIFFFLLMIFWLIKFIYYLELNEMEQNLQLGLEQVLMSLHFNLELSLIFLLFFFYFLIFPINFFFSDTQSQFIHQKMVLKSHPVYPFRLLHFLVFFSFLLFLLTSKKKTSNFSHSNR